MLAPTLTDELPELDQLNRKQIAALLEVALLTCDSSRLRGRRINWGGRARVRAAVYVGTLVAVRHNPNLYRFHERLVAARKPEKVALTACVQKLVLILNALLPRRVRWQAPGAPAAP